MNRLIYVSFFLFLSCASFAQNAIVNLVGFSFSPENITITAGQTVQWNNTGGEHNVNGSLATYPNNPEGFFSGAPEEAPWTYDFTFTQPGVYDYQCDPHTGFGMFGTVTVLPAPPSTPDLIISGAVDGPLQMGLPKAVELYALRDIDDLSAYGFGSANNGQGSDGVEFTFPAVAVDSGSCIYLATDVIGFSDFFGFPPDFTDDFATAINGNDALELFKDSVVIDVFGEIDVDGSGQPWEYTNGWVYRKNGTGPDGNTFVLDNWIFSGLDALTGETSNSTAATPFPLCSFKILLQAIDDNVTTEINTITPINVLTNDILPNPITLIEIVDMPSNGMVNPAGASDFSYIPNQDFCGEDQFTYQVCDDISCDTATVFITVNCPAPATPFYTIGEVTADSNNDFIPDSTGVYCFLEGVVYGVNLRENDLLFTIIDENDPEDGLSVFSLDVNFGYTVTEGDLIRVRGTVEQFNGLNQINIDTLSVEMQGVALHAPQVVTALDESTESKLIRINGLQLVDSTANASGVNYTVDNGSMTFTMRFDAQQADLFGKGIPFEFFDVIGIGGQFDQDDPADGGYQILPRYMPDILNAVSVTGVNLEEEIKLWPNPVSDQLNIQSNVTIDRIVVRNILGQEVATVKQPSQSLQLDWSNLESGLYSVTFMVGSEVQTKLVFKN